MVRLKINIFVCHMFLNRVPTKYNFVRRHIIALTYHNCSDGCGLLEDMDHLFVKCHFYDRFWSLVSGWLGLSTTTHSNLLVHLVQFGGLGDIRNMFGWPLVLFGYQWFGSIGKREIGVFLCTTRNIIYNPFDDYNRHMLHSILIIISEGLIIFLS